MTDQEQSKFTSVGVSGANRTELETIRQEIAKTSPVPAAKVSMDDVISVLIKHYRANYTNIDIEGSTS